jgi:hypothetical protein
MQAIDEQTRQKFYTLSMLVNDVDGTLSPLIVAPAPEFDYQAGLVLHPSLLRSVGLWVGQGLWMYRNLELNVTTGATYKVGEAMALAPIDHPLLGEQVARMLARCGREIVTNVADRVIVPRETVAEVFDAHVSSAARLAFSARAWLTRNGYQTEW